MRLDYTYDNSYVLFFKSSNSNEGTKSGKISGPER